MSDMKPTAPAPTAGSGVAAKHDPLIEAVGLSTGYGSVAVVRGVDLHVEPGEVVALLGANGAGKSSTLLALAGVLPVLEGEVRWRGQRTTAPLHRRARDGLAFVTEQRSVFARMSTMDNLRVGRCHVGRALELFPELEARLHIRAGLLSGGEQQMLTLARALARNPRLLLADELSLGLAPLSAARLLRAVRQAADSGVGVLLVEQHIEKAMQVSDRVYVMRRGRVELSGAASELQGRLAEIETSYLAGAPTRPTNGAP